MSINDLNEILAEIRSEREDGNEVRVLQLLASIPTAPRRAEVAPFAGVAPEVVDTIHFAADFLSRVDEDGDVTDPRWLVRDAADLASAPAWREVTSRILRDLLPTIPRWERHASGPAFAWCADDTDPSGLEGLAGRTAIVPEAPDTKMRWVAVAGEDEHEVETIASLVWDADQYGTIVAVIPTPDGYEVWSCWA